MSYEIKSYEESFIEKQVEIGNEVTREWVGYNMASVENIRNSYSADGFDPETRLYAFKDSEMVGFLTGYVRENSEGEKEANYRLPIIKPNHPDAAKALIEHSFEILRSKGAKRINTTLKNDWGNFKENAEAFGFIYDREASNFALSDVSNLIVPKVSSKYTVEELDLELHGEALKTIFQEAFGMNEEGAENNLNMIKSFDQNLIITHSAIFEGNKILGRVLLYKPSEDSTEAYLGNIYAPGDNETIFFDLFMDRVLNKSKQKGIERINKTILGDNLKKENYEKYGFSFEHIINYYSKDLS